MYDGLSHLEYTIIKNILDTFRENNPEEIARMHEILDAMKDSPINFTDIIENIFGRIDFEHLFEHIVEMNDQCSYGILPDLPEGGNVREMIVAFLDENYPQIAQILRIIGIIDD